MQFIATHDVDDIDHWFNSSKRSEFFAPYGISVTAFRPEPADGTTTAVLVDCPDMETFQKALATPEAAAAMKHDGVHGDTIQVFLAD